MGNQLKSVKPVFHRIHEVPFLPQGIQTPDGDTNPHMESFSLRGTGDLKAIRFAIMDTFITMRENFLRNYKIADQRRLDIRVYIFSNRIHTPADTDNRADFAFHLFKPSLMRM